MTSEQKEKDTMLLDYFQACLESNISDFAISKIEDLYDEDEDELVRAIWMERGTSQLQIDCDGKEVRVWRHDPLRSEDPYQHLCSFTAKQG